MKPHNLAVAAGTLMALACLAIVASTAPANETNHPTPRKTFELKGKIVAVMTVTAGGLELNEDSHYLVDARLEQIGGRHFIRGVTWAPQNADKNVWGLTGIETGIAWDKVLSFHIFTPEQMEAYFRDMAPE